MQSLLYFISGIVIGGISGILMMCLLIAGHDPVEYDEGRVNLLNKETEKKL